MGAEWRYTKKLKNCTSTRNQTYHDAKRYRATTPSAPRNHRLPHVQRTWATRRAKWCAGYGKTAWRRCARKARCAWPCHPQEWCVGNAPYRRTLDPPFSFVDERIDVVVIPEAVGRVRPTLRGLAMPPQEWCVGNAPYRRNGPGPALGVLIFRRRPGVFACGSAAGPPISRGWPCTPRASSSPSAACTRCPFRRRGCRPLRW